MSGVDSSRTLWLLRHAKAVADPPSGGEDFDRVLAPRGRKDAAELGQFLTGKAQGLGIGPLELPEIAFVSPAARTMATAELALGSLDHRPTVESPEDLYGADPEEVLDHLRAL